MDEDYVDLILVAFLTVYGVGTIALFHSSTLILTALLGLSTAASLYIWTGKKNFTFYILGAIFGSLAEITPIYFGAWTYSNPTAIGIPIWLPLAWGKAALLIKRLEVPAQRILGSIDH